MISHPYLDDVLNKIRLTHIPWEKYRNVGLLTENEVAMINYVENVTTNELIPIMSEHGLYYAVLYLELMHKLARVDAIQKVLVLIHDMLFEHEERIALFHQAGDKVKGFPFGPFYKALRIGDEFIGLQSSKILTLLICSTSQKSNINIEELFKWMTFQLQSHHQHVIDLNIQMLDTLFHLPEYRKAFWNTSHAVDSLVNILKISCSNQKDVGPQKMYELTMAIWLLTFDCHIARNLEKKCQIIPTLIDIAKFAVKDKVIRVVIATFRNFIEKASMENMPAMLVSKLLPLCDHLATRKWTDQDIADDVQFIRSELEKSFQSRTTFEVYASELETGMLQWSPSHLSEVFWKENTNRLNDNNQKLLKQLVRLLSSSTNPLILSVACYDIGQYAKYSVKEGKRHLQSLGAKQRVMELMTHENSDVRYHALLATQKYFSIVQ
ncbi:armadillo-type protein [Cokeromyces recurvatus]|uniref:armadillo-type protein n=1 Tax=Cokeromyces recurvatus TaxID=90255 RepID=UPI00221E660C|nr:armadillo-type protein [Cokeromyces recurvatus]KAI7901019.1 armadillo-type protein [Cokeromyces recurvatus]